eukprot:728887_1
MNIARKQDITVYHCPNEKTKIDEAGYDLCSKCATKELLALSHQMGTEGGADSNNAGSGCVDIDGKKKILIPNGYISDTNNPPCICGKELVQTPAKEAYKASNTIGCDLCSKSCIICTRHSGAFRTDTNGSIGAHLHLWTTSSFTWGFLDISPFNRE